MFPCSLLPCIAVWGGVLSTLYSVPLWGQQGVTRHFIPVLSCYTPTGVIVFYSDHGIIILLCTCTWQNDVALLRTKNLCKYPMRRNRSINSQLLIIVLFELTDNQLLIFNSSFDFLPVPRLGWECKEPFPLFVALSLSSSRFFPFLPLDMSHVYDSVIIAYSLLLRISSYAVSVPGSRSHSTAIHSLFLHTDRSYSNLTMYTSSQDDSSMALRTLTNSMNLFNITLRLWRSAMLFVLSSGEIKRNP